MNNIFTIVTPSLNQGRFIEQTLKSVLDQVGNFYIDYIIADGGSTDRSVEIIKKYDKLIKEKKYPIKCQGIELRWWSESDKGQTQALNKGFHKGRGDICAWINSDDYYAPGALNIIMSEFNQHPEVDLIYGNCFEMFESGEVRQGEALPGDFKKNVREGCLISQPAAFFTKKVFEKVGYLNESYQYCMDYDLWLKILKDHKALFIKKDLAYFRIWPESKTGNKRQEFVREENQIRNKYGGSAINPGSIHRFRYKIPGTGFLKKCCPRFYFLCKNIVYKVINFDWLK